MRTKVIAVGVVVLVVACGLLVAQPQGRGGQRPGGQPGQRGQRGQFDMDRFRQMMNERMKTQLGASDAEWTVIEPRLTKVMTLSRQAGSGGRGMMGMFMGQRRGPGGAPGAPGDRGSEGRTRPQRPDARELTAVEKAGEQLRTTLENTAASAEQIKAQLIALRNAREKARQELIKAQKDLQQILTLRQEAQLVLMGLLN